MEINLSNQFIFLCTCADTHSFFLNTELPLVFEDAEFDTFVRVSRSSCFSLLWMEPRICRAPGCGHSTRYAIREAAEGNTRLSGPVQALLMSNRASREVKARQAVPASSTHNQYLIIQYTINVTQFSIPCHQVTLCNLYYMCYCTVWCSCLVQYDVFSWMMPGLRRGLWYLLHVACVSLLMRMIRFRLMLMRFTIMLCHRL